MTMQNTYTPPPLPPGATPWSPNAVPVRFNPTTRTWEFFANGQWLARPGMTFEQINAMGRAGQAYQIDYAASGGQANTAAVQREIAPRVFAADNAQLSPEGSILAPGTPTPPRQAVATQQRPNPAVFAPDGAQLSETGSILSLPASAPGPAPAPATPLTTNVDPGANWDYSGRPPQATAPPATAAPRRPQETEFALPPPAAPDWAAYDRSIGVNNPAASPLPRDPNRPPSRDEMWLEWILGAPGPATAGAITPAFSQGGYQRPRYAEGGLQLPDAIVGEGLESATPQFDTPERSELTLQPMPALGPDIFKVRVAEGPTGVQADGGMLVLPLSEPAANIAREHLRPADGLKGEMNGPNFEAGPLSLPTAPGPGGAGTPAMATGGFAFDINPPQQQQPEQPSFEGVPPLDPSQVQRGVLPPASLAVPSEEWAGLPGGAPPPMGNINDFARTSNAQRARYDQWLKSLGILGGVDAVEQYFRQTAPTRLNLPTFAG